jgi:tRNA threonylcarbamoyladenosine biosynthesis protein TsaB
LASEPPLILGFDTSAAQCAAALLCGTEVRARRDEAMPRGQAERLLPMLEEVLDEAGAGWSDLDALAVCTGPGNFTGLRLGVAAARGLALALGIPAIGVTLFEALAEGRRGFVLVAVPDKRGGGFVQAFRDGSALGPPTGAEPATLGTLPERTLCLGFAAAELAARLGLAAGPEAILADPAALARLAAQRLSTPQPRPTALYLRPADALPPADLPPALLDET